jgi:hypothetical protein
VAATLPPRETFRALRLSDQFYAEGADTGDFNGDGLLDVVTRKRFWAHGPTGDKEPDAPAVVFWFQLCRGGDQEQLRAEIPLAQARTELSGFERELVTARHTLLTLLVLPALYTLFQGQEAAAVKV